MNGCFCNNKGDIRSLLINGRRTWITGLRDISGLWSSEGKRPADIAPSNILEAVHRYNHVSDSVEKEFIEAIRSEYNKYVEEKTKDEKGRSPS